MPAKDVKAYLKRNKNDAADATAICEAVRRPTMRFVRITGSIGVEALDGPVEPDGGDARSPHDP
jgi:hypothetical protein